MSEKAGKQTYVLEYRKHPGGLMRDVFFGADNQERADAAGRKYCEMKSDGLNPWRFLRARPLLQFTDDEMLTEKAATAEVPVARPTIEAQKAALNSARRWPWVKGDPAGDARPA